jgi:hypothetical protein
MRAYGASVMTGGSEPLQVRARDFALSLGRVMMAALLLEHALWSGEEADCVAVEQWCLKMVFIHSGRPSLLCVLHSLYSVPQTPLLQPTLAILNKDQGMIPLSWLGWLVYNFADGLRLCLVAARVKTLALDLNANGMPQGYV